MFSKNLYPVDLLDIDKRICQHLLDNIFTISFYSDDEQWTSVDNLVTQFSTFPTMLQAFTFICRL